jgi:HAD superfamily hydrolase (TIGR01490 family)
MEIPGGQRERKGRFPGGHVSGGVAAFFDLDGTLTKLPSMERRFFLWLKTRGEIFWGNCFLWIAEAARLAPQGISAIQHSNKMYLRGIRIFNESGASDEVAAARHTDGHQATGQAGAPSSGGELRNPGSPVPEFLERTVKRVVWHARQGHKIVIVSGTLEPLARKAARSLQEQLVARGINSAIRVVATRLEERSGRWTGRIVGEAMFGETKARAMKKLADEMRLELTHCYAYGDSLSDRWMLGAVGKPAAVNPQTELARLAKTKGWPVLQWQDEKHLTKRSASGLSESKVRAVWLEKKEERAAIASLSDWSARARNE